MLELKKGVDILAEAGGVKSIDEARKIFRDKLDATHLARLEKIVGRLEDESVGFEEALELFEAGMELARSCRSRLEEVEQRVTRLLASEEDDELRTEDLEVDL